MDKAEAFEALFRVHYTAVLRYAERRLDDREAARDICSETFAVAWKKFDPAAPHPLPWLYRTAHNLIGNSYRRASRERRAIVDMQDRLRADAAATPLDVLDEALAQLSPSEQEALRLTFWEELPAAEVALVLGCSEQAAWKRISRAKAALRTAIARMSGEGAGDAR